jgi:hypothetical protein
MPSCRHLHLHLHLHLHRRRHFYRYRHLINDLAGHADTAFWGSVKAQARPSIDGSPFPLARKPPRQGAPRWRQGTKDRYASKALNACGQFGDLSYAWQILIQKNPLTLL